MRCSNDLDFIVGVSGIFLFFGQSLGAQLVDFQECCYHCRGDQDIWMQVESNWSLTVEEEEIVNFQNPPAYLADDEQTVRTSLYSHDYIIRYGGAPVRIEHSTLDMANQILLSQYLQVDLGLTRDVAGVGIQGGFYEDAADELLYRTESWVTRFLASYSIDGSSYAWVSGSPEMFDANYDASTYVIVGFPSPVSARYIRVHPLEARDSKGDVKSPLMRVSVVTCVMDGVCDSPRINCYLRDWQSWGDCTCDKAGCVQERVRKVARYQSCGGAPCENTKESQACSPPTPLWKILLQWIGVGILCLVVIIIVIVILVKKFKKPGPEVVFKDKKTYKKDKKKRELRQDLAGQDGGETDLKEETLDGEGDNDFDEKAIAPTAAVISEAKPKTTTTPHGKTGGAAGDDYDLGDTTSLGSIGKEVEGLYNNNNNTGNDTVAPPRPVQPQTVTKPDPFGRDASKPLATQGGAAGRGLAPLGGGKGLPPVGGPKTGRTGGMFGDEEWGGFDSPPPYSP